MADIERVIHGTLLGEAVLNARLAALVADDGGVYIAANDAACDLTGYTRVQLTSFRMGNLAADAESADIYAHVARGRKLHGRKQVRRQDGTVVSCDYWAIETRVSRLPYFVLLLWPEGRPALS